MTDANWEAYGAATADVADRLMNGEINMPRAIKMLADLDAATGRHGELNFHNLLDVAQRAAFKTNMHDTLVVNGRSQDA